MLWPHLVIKAQSLRIEKVMPGYGRMLVHISDLRQLKANKNNYQNPVKHCKLLNACSLTLHVNLSVIECPE